MSAALGLLRQDEALRRARLRVAERITDLIGETPLVRLSSLEKDVPGVELWAKCEFMNPGGSVKDRPAYQMIADALRGGRLRPGQAIIDSTSGNTGVAYSLIGGALGFRVVLVMPENVSWARRRIATAFGTEIVFTDPMEGSDGAILKVREMVAADPGAWFYPDQYSNESNPLAHYLGTGREIWEQTSGRVTHFVAGIGTSGTVMGTGRRLKEHRRSIRVIALEPDDALHGLKGLKHMASSLVPGIYRPTELDGAIAMPTEEAWRLSERLSIEEGLLVGHSSGANAAGALRIGRDLVARGQGGVVVTVFPDRADRYFEAPVETLMPPFVEPGQVPVGRPPTRQVFPTAAALAEIYDHARREYPRECCGLLAGPREAPQADEATPCRNIQDELHAREPARHVRDARSAFALPTPDLFAMARSLRGARPVKIVYHSHPDVGAYFSETDQSAAQLGGEPAYPVEHLVIDVRQDGVFGAAQFAWDERLRRYVEVARWATGGSGP